MKRLWLLTSIFVIIAVIGMCLIADHSTRLAVSPEVDVINIDKGDKKMAIPTYNPDGAPRSGSTLSQILFGEIADINQLNNSTEAIATGYGDNYGFGDAAAAAKAKATADEQAAYDDQIGSLNQLLGYTGQQRDAGLANLTSKFQGESQTMNRNYDEQGVKNTQAKEKGVGQVESFGSDSWKNLQRILQGANAGNSSVGRELLPFLISKGMGTRRQGVMETAGENEQNIFKAREEGTRDLEEQRKSQESSFREGILTKENDLLNQKRQLEIQRAMADGTGYATARAAGNASQAGINDRMSQLGQLFGQFKPNFTTKAAPELGQFTVDKGLINTGAGQQANSGQNYYQQMLKRKQEGVL